MNISEHMGKFEQEMLRRNYSKNSIKSYVSCIGYFFSKSPKDHPKNITEQDINLIQRLAGHSNVKTTAIYTHISHNLISKIQSPLSNITL